MTDAAALAAVVAAYGWAAARTEPIAGGLINATYRVSSPAGEPLAVVQRLHPVFAAEVNLDIDAVTAHLAAAGLATPRVLRTPAGALWHEVDGRCWRALSFEPGASFARVPSVAHARSAGELVGRVHAALASLERRFAFVRAGVHDTALHLGRLERVLVGEASPVEPALLAEARALGHEIVGRGRALPSFAALPRRVAHGDLKLSNVLFDGARAHCLVDLDTVGHQTMAYELGDLLRSWCNPAGEDEPRPRFELPVLAAAIAGYGAGAPGLLSAAETASLVPGLETVCVELAARFCVDVFDDAYFGWDAGRFASRREHNLVRARGQLALADAVAAVRAEASDVVIRALG